MALAELPPPADDPNGDLLMASLRRRVAGGGASDPHAAQYAPALAAVRDLLARRRSVGGSLQEMDRLEAVQRDLQALARGF